MMTSTMPDPVPVLPGIERLPETNGQTFSPEELYFFDDIMDEVGLFMDVAMTGTAPDSTTAAPVTPTSTSSSTSVVSESSASYDNSAPVMVTPSTSSADLQLQTDFNVPNPIALSDTMDQVTTLSSKSKGSAKPALPAPKVSKTTTTAVQAPKAASSKAKRRSVVAKATPSLKKRRMSAPVKEVDPNDKQEIARRHRNREHAKRSRLRKKSLTQTLEQSAQDLKEENEYLRNKMYVKFGQESTDEMVRTRIINPTEKFILSLKQPGNTMLNKSALSYLKSLSDSTRAKVSA